MSKEKGGLMFKTIGLVLLSVALYARFKKKLRQMRRAARQAVWTFKVLGLESEDEGDQHGQIQSR